MEEDHESEEEFKTVNELNIEDNKSHASGLSDPDEELETYDPMPYAFVLKDAKRRPLLIPSIKLYRARINCPPFYILLDHVVAVLWCFYSRAGHAKLGTSQLHWTIKFLEGVHDNRNKYTKDVLMVIDDLEKALVEISASRNEQEIINRKYEQNFESVRLLPPDSPRNYAHFTINLRNCDNQGSCIEDAVEDAKEPTNGLNTTLVSSKSPSIILNCFIEASGMTNQAIPPAESEDECESVCSARSSSPVCENQVPTAEACDVYMRRNSLIDHTIRQLEEIRDLDNTLAELNLKCPNPE